MERRHRRGEAILILVICVMGVLAKIGLLLSSQRAVDSDEAIVGLMALHIQQGTTHPIFFYGQSYDAAAGLVAHAAAVAFRLLGVSVISLKAVALLVWLCMIALASSIVRSWVGWRAAGISAALMLWAPSSVEWAMKARGGHMLAVIFTLVTIALALHVLNLEPEDRRRRYGVLAAIGACGAAAAWSQPSSAPVVALVISWIAVRSVQEGQLVSAALLGAAVAAVSGILIVVLRTTTTSWTWQMFAGADMRRDPVMLFTTVLPGLFTPDLDWSIPAAPPWIAGIGWLWLITVAGAWLMGIVAIWRSRIRHHLHQPPALFLAATCCASTSMFIADTQYVSPRILLVLYPLGCMMVAAAVEFWRQHSKQSWPFLFVVILLVSGIAVHIASIGPATIHGAGEQQARLPATIVDAMVADLDQHRVQCLFSESPMLQWNVMFASQERIAARWLTARDRWQPYVERVNAAFLAGEHCALLLRDVSENKRIATLRTYFGERSSQLTVFNEQYALLYDPPAKLITSVFKREGGWDPLKGRAEPAQAR